MDDFDEGLPFDPQDGFSGFYSDDGEKLNPDHIIKPGLCLTCAKNNDPSEYILCTLTQLGDYDEFICHAYVAIDDSFDPDESRDE